MIAVIDNYDSFTYNLVQYLGELGCEVGVYRNDAVTVQELEQATPSHVLISPGPGDPSQAGISNDVIQYMGKHTPILGVCLGQQCIGHVFGGQVVKAQSLMHGKASPIYHHGDQLFDRLPNPFVAGRYHSLIVDTPLPECLEVTAFTREGELMGIRHRTYPIFGVQFHPESILTEGGKIILQNFLAVGRVVGDLTVPWSDNPSSLFVQ